MCPAVSAARALRVLLLVLSLALVIPQHWESRVQVTLGSRVCCSAFAWRCCSLKHACAPSFVCEKAGGNHDAPSLHASQRQGALCDFWRICWHAHLALCEDRSEPKVTRKRVVAGGNFGGGHGSARAPARYCPLAHGRGAEGSQCQSAGACREPCQGTSMLLSVSGICQRCVSAWRWCVPSARARRN